MVMPLIPFPNSAKPPGVPAIPRLPNAKTVVQAGLGIVQGAVWRIFQVETQWGIFDKKGKPLGDPAKITGIAGNILESIGIGSTLSTNSVSYVKEARVSDFPVERGGFASYNKVELPGAPVVTLCISGFESDRKSFLDAIDAACKSTDLYKVVTPEVSYIDYSIERYAYQRRSDKGTTMLLVELSLKEVRQVSSKRAESKIKTAKDKGATPPVDGGAVQPAAPSPSVLKKIGGFITRGACASFFRY